MEHDHTRLLCPACEAATQRIKHLEEAMNRIANGTRLPGDDFQKAMHKVTTEALGDAYKPFPLQF